MSEALTKIEQDIKDAMKARDSVTLGVLRMLANRIKMVAKNDRNREVVDQDVITGIQKAIKEANETRDILVANGRDTAEQDAEIAILSRYLPRQMTEEELRTRVASIYAELEADGALGKSAMGALMARLKTAHSGEYDARLASKIASEVVNP